MPALNRKYSPSNDADSRRRVGIAGEHYAIQYLRHKGYQLVAKNWRTKIGEIDLVFTDRNEIVIIEVKTRLESRFADKFLLTNVTLHKQRKLIALARLYLIKHYSAAAIPPARIDVIGIILSRANFQPEKIEHVVGAVAVECDW